MEAKKYDCSRGCTVERAESGEVECNYRQGCCKLEVYDWLQGVSQEQYKDYFEVRFKNTRKGIYRNGSGQSIKTGDLVIVEAANGHDLGIVTLEGPIVARQMKCRKIDPETYEFKKGETILVPADMPDFFLVPRDTETLLLEAVTRPAEEVDGYIDPETEAFLEGEDYEGLEDGAFDDDDDDDIPSASAGASPLKYFS